jgi:hypothetical protein
VRDDAYTPFDPPPEPPRPGDVIVFVLARTRGDRTDSMRGSLRTGPHGWEAVYLLNGEIYQSQWFASEALTRADPGKASGHARGRRLDRRAVPAVTGGL